MTSSGDTRATLRHLFGHLIVPLLMCVGMGLAYLGAFHQPEPHDLRVAIVGSGPRTQVLAQTLKDKAADALDVRTVPTRDTAVSQLQDQKIFGAYAPGASPELLVASAGSDTTATVVQKVFTDVASAQHAPLKVTDVAPPAKGDPTAQGLFFLLVALSIGSYTSVAAIGGAGAPLPMRLRALIAVGTGLVVSAIGTLLAGPVFHLVDHDLPALFGMAAVYTTGILLIGVGLHTFLKRFTMLAMMVLFVMLNFTTAGGVFRPELQNGFFASLHSFWTGAGFVEGVRSLVYFDGHALGGHLLTLGLWLLAGVVLICLAAYHESRARRPRPAPALAREDLEQELEEAVPA
ncbi:hypothetical protein [Actinomadura harenae]|uniref:ABC transporter permease n=1 Tax=Actinomadura harenae TaxID=2483351 RepID=A0A3M2MB14_9ACTN|nr:hypothetical protein [Actinomadura harenae]RMI44358.1 hypothetical protein EBO15_13265 [Actinomadura harenae]